MGVGTIFVLENGMRNDDPEYVAQLEAALESAEKEITDNRNEANELHRIIAEMSAKLNPTHMGEPVIASRAALTEGMEPVAWKFVSPLGTVRKFQDRSPVPADPEAHFWTALYTADQLAAAHAKGREEGLREAKAVVLGGHFLHDQAPAKLFANECAAAIERLLGEKP